MTTNYCTHTTDHTICDTCMGRTPKAEKELPGTLALAQGVHRQAFPHTIDAAVWAKEFRATQLNLGQEPLDEGWMISWFANAIMAGFDTAQSRQDTALTEAQAQGRREQAEMDATLLESLAGKAHTYGSENADVYHAYDNGLRQGAKAIRAQAGQKEAT